MANNHLNLFQFFNENPDKQYIENNVSRALSICLLNDSFFLNTCLKEILDEDDFHYLFSTSDEEAKLEIDLQVTTGYIQKESFAKVYAVALTSAKYLDMKDFFSLDKHANEDKINITDIVISVKDILIVIEVKITEEDCRAQLYNQVASFIGDDGQGIPIIPKFISWKTVVKLMEQNHNIMAISGLKSVYVKDFLSLVEGRFFNWFEPKPFNTISFSSNRGDTNYVQLTKRMKQALAGLSAPNEKNNYELLPYNDRLGVSIPFAWAREVIPEFHSYENDSQDYVGFYIWPGNTKQQGYGIFNKSLDWTEKNCLKINGVEYKLEVERALKLCHFNKFISGTNFGIQDLKEGKELYTRDNFYEYSGKWDRHLWPKFESMMDEYFKEEFEWRKRCKWLESFSQTDRQYFTISFGFEATLFIPYEEFKRIDRKPEDIDKVTGLIGNVIESFQNLLQ